MSWTELQEVYNGDRPLPVELPEHQEAERTARVIGKVPNTDDNSII